MGYPWVIEQVKDLLTDVADLQDSAFRKSGGEVTGDVTIHNDDPNLFLRHSELVKGGTFSGTKYQSLEPLYADGSSLAIVQSRVDSSGRGYWNIQHRNLAGTLSPALCVGLDADGNSMFTFNGANILTSAGGKVTGGFYGPLNSNLPLFKNTVDSAGIAIFGGSTRETGASITLHGGDNTSAAGQVYIRTYSGEDTSVLRGLPSGTWHIDGKSILTSAHGAAIPAGAIIAFAANKTPAGGFLICNGAAVSRTTYAALFAAIGTTYGTGDGSTTFNLPNLTDKFIQGSGTAGTVKAAGLPTHTHTIALWGNTTDYHDRNGTVGHVKCNGYKPSGRNSYTSNASSAPSSSIYGKSTTVQPPAVTMRYYIKY